MRLKGSDAVAVTLFGDGATSEGAFHEGANIAAVMKAPLVLLCNNNQWAISTPLSAQTAAARLADKAIGYGMPALRVDGHDVLAVYEAVKRGRRAARAGDADFGGGHLSLGPHATADDPEPVHRPQAGRRGAGARLRHDVRGVLERLGVLDARKAAVKEEALAMMRAGIQAAEDEPAADPSLVFAHAYAEPLPTLARDLDELRRVHAP